MKSVSKLWSKSLYGTLLVQVTVQKGILTGKEKTLFQNHKIAKDRKTINIYTACNII